MKRGILALAMAACLTACVTSPTQQASTALTRAEAAYERVRLFADVLSPLLPPTYQARLAASQAVAERALAAARVAVTLAEQLAALRRAEAAVADIAAITGAQ